MNREGIPPQPPMHEGLHDKLSGFIAAALFRRSQIIAANESMQDILEENDLSNTEQLVLRWGSNDVVPTTHDVVKLGPDIGESRIAKIFNIRVRFPVLSYLNDEEGAGELEELPLNDLFIEVNEFNGPKTRYLLNTNGIWCYETADDVEADPTLSGGNYFRVNEPGAHRYRVDDPETLLGVLAQVLQDYEPKRQHRQSPDPN